MTPKGSQEGALHYQNLTNINGVVNHFGRGVLTTGGHMVLRRQFRGAYIGIFVAGKQLTTHTEPQAVSHARHTAEC